MSNIIRQASAGTLESSDAFVSIEPRDEGLVIEIDSVVKEQFGEAIRAAAESVLREMDVQHAALTITDRGALDCVIRARVETAIMRGREE